MGSQNSYTFTDDDLKRLQKQLNDGFIFDPDTYDFKALLTRLEAAEQCVKALELCELNGMMGQVYWPEYLIKWRKAAGK